MTYTSDNIVGVEFTVAPNTKRTFKVGYFGKSGSPIISWKSETGLRCKTEAYTAATIAHNLNNGTWIVKPKQ